MKRRLVTRLNQSGYREFWDAKERRWVRTHRRLAEKLYGELPPDVHVHHINGDKLDNRPENLVPVYENVHRRIHDEDPDGCFRCGRSGHCEQECYARTDFEGNELEDDDEV